MFRFTSPVEAVEAVVALIFTEREKRDSSHKS